MLVTHRRVAVGGIRELALLEPRIRRHSVSFDPPGAVSNTPFFAGTGGLGSGAPLPAGSNVFAFPTAETMEGADLNGDSDMADTVLRYVRYAP